MDNEWTLVSSARKKKSSKQKPKKRILNITKPPIESDLLLIKHLKHFQIKHCICLGLGSLSSKNSQKQYALLLFIK